jgi:hypothetical protein
MSMLILLAFNDSVSLFIDSASSVMSSASTAHSLSKKGDTLELLLDPSGTKLLRDFAVLILITVRIPV